MSLLLLFFFGGIILSTSARGSSVSAIGARRVSTSELGSVADRTSEGRSEFHPTPVNSPVQFPLGAFTVFFRPMPYETHSPQEILTALEDVALLGVLLLSAQRLWAALRARSEAAISAVLHRSARRRSSWSIRRSRTSPSSLESEPRSPRCYSSCCSCRVRNRWVSTRRRCDRKGLFRRSRTLRDPSGDRTARTRHRRPVRGVVVALPGVDTEPRSRVRVRPALSIVCVVDRSPTSAARSRVSSCGTTRPRSRSASEAMPRWRWSTRDDVLPAATTEIDRASVAASADDVVLLHASAVLGAGGPVLLIGPSGAGKSTLSAALAIRGWTYVGDEVIGIDEAATQTFANPKPWKLDRRSRVALADFGGAAVDDGPSERETLIAPLDLGAVHPPGPAGPPVAIVRVAFRAGADAVVSSRSRVDGAELLADQCFNFARWGRVLWTRSSHWRAGRPHCISTSATCRRRSLRSNRRCDDGCGRCRGALSRESGRAHGRGRRRSVDLGRPRRGTAPAQPVRGAHLARALVVANRRRGRHRRHPRDGGRRRHA